MQGRVTCFFTSRRYGFLAEISEGGEDWFFHEEDLAPGSAVPAKGQFVTFDAGEFRGRKKAVNVRVLPTKDAILSGRGGVE